MFRLNKLTDYAVVILSHMARHPVQHSTSMLATETAVNEPTVAKVLKDLVKANLVTSVRGASGGYTLNGDAETINIRQVIEAIEGPIALADCVEGHATGCAVMSCGTRGNWDEVNAKIISALEEVKLIDMMRAPEKTVQKTPQIVQIQEIA